MKKHNICLLTAMVITAAAYTSAHAQVQNVVVTDGTSAACFDQTGAATCPALDLTQGAGVELYAEDAAGSLSSVHVRPNQANIKSQSSAGFSQTTYTPTMVLSGADNGTTQSVMAITPTQIQLSADKGASTLIVNSTGTAITGVLSATGASTLNGINNQSAGITNAGLVSGVTAGTVSATSTEAINGSQLFTTNTNVATAQTTADTALANAATVQTTANTALTNAAAAQTTANTALTNAAAAQTTADSALTNSATALTTANTALTTADAAMTKAGSAMDGVSLVQESVHFVAQKAVAAQSTANTALTNAATAQTTADTALTSAQSAKTLATTANTNAATALTTANEVKTTVAGFDGRISALENTVNNYNNHINSVEKTASRGVAIAMAAASIPPLEAGKKLGVGVGVGHYNGENAFSLALGARVSDSVQLRFNLGTGGNGKAAVGAGGMYSW